MNFDRRELDKPITINTEQDALYYEQVYWQLYYNTSFEAQEYRMRIQKALDQLRQKQQERMYE